MQETTDNRVIRLVTAANLQEASVWVQALEEEGICCRLVGDILGNYGVFQGAMCPEIWVLKKDEEQARILLESHHHPAVDVETPNES